MPPCNSQIKLSRTINFGLQRRGDRRRYDHFAGFWRYAGLESEMEDRRGRQELLALPGKPDPMPSSRHGTISGTGYLHSEPICRRSPLLPVQADNLTYTFSYNAPDTTRQLLGVNRLGRAERASACLRELRLLTRTIFDNERDIRIHARCGEEFFHAEGPFI